MKTRVIGHSALAAVGLAPSWALAQQTQEPERYRYGPHMMMDWTGAWYGMIFGPLFMILVLAVAIAAAVIVARGLGTQPPQPGRAPLDILKERYARGEIEKEEFEERRRVLDE